MQATFYIEKCGCDWMIENRPNNRGAGELIRQSRQDRLPHYPVAGYPVQTLNSRLFVSNVPDDDLGLTVVGDPG